MLKSNGPNTDPWGTPKSTLDQLLNLVLAFVLCQRFFGKLFIKLCDLLVNPYTRYLASKRL